MSIAVIGGLNIDLLFTAPRAPESGESLDATSLSLLPGGKGANTAVATHRASRTSAALVDAQEEQINVFMNGAVGDDDFGRQLVQALEGQGVDVRGVQRVGTDRTGTCAVFVETLSNDSRNLGYQGANLCWKPPNFNSDSLHVLTGGQRPDLIVAHFGIPSLVIEGTLKKAHADGIDTLLNPAPAYVMEEETYKCLTHIVLNQAEAAILSPSSKSYQAAAERFLALGVKNVVITLGSQGAYYAMSAGASGLVQAVKDVKVIDTTGAGDTFVGTYAAAYVSQKSRRQWNIRQAVEKACRAAAKTVETLGAMDGMPWMDEIED